MLRVQTSLSPWSGLGTQPCHEVSNKNQRIKHNELYRINKAVLLTIVHRRQEANKLQIKKNKTKLYQSIGTFIISNLKTHSLIWDNFWHLKALDDEKCFLFHLKSSFLSWRFGHVAKRLDKKGKVNFKFYDVTALLTNNRNTHIAQNFEKQRQWQKQKQSDNEIWSVNRMYHEKHFSWNLYKMWWRN